MESLKYRYITFAHMVRQCLKGRLRTIVFLCLRKGDIKGECVAFFCGPSLNSKCKTPEHFKMSSESLKLVIDPSEER
jgi:hypothetical protein